MYKNLWLVVLAAMAFPVVAAANPGDPGMLPLSSSFMFSPASKVLDASAGGPAFVRPPLAPAPLAVNLVRHRPYPYRVRARRSSMPVMPFTAQVHIGLFDPINDFSTGFSGGFRIGPQVAPNVRVGLAMDWWHDSDGKVLDLGTVERPGGTANEELILSETTANLVPILMFVQVSGRENMSLVPYGGFGVGYEWLVLTANDYLAHESYDQTFGGLGWQAWVGAGLPLDARTRLNAEVYVNGCEADSEVDVYIDGYGPATVRDVVKMNGVGIRFGFSCMF